MEYYLGTVGVRDNHFLKLIKAKSPEQATIILHGWLRKRGKGEKVLFISEALTEESTKEKA